MHKQERPFNDHSLNGGSWIALLMLRAVITSQRPTLLMEIAWMAIWFSVGLALLQGLLNEIIA